MDLANVSTDLAPDRATARKVEAFACRVIAGPDMGRVFALDGQSAFNTLIGTSPACAIQLTDRRVSRRHAALELARGELRVRDLGSTNGLRIKHVRIVEAVLVDGEELELGDTVLRIETSAYGSELVHSASFRRVLGISSEMSRVYAIATRLAASDLPTIIEGETGTGKELLAESIHDASARARGPFIVADCTTLATHLIETELFGHQKGAFTGATATRKGVFEQAHGGTLFVDEIGDLDLALQAKLLRAIERGEIRRVGGNTWIRVDVRIIAATRRDLDQQVQLGLFRDDLFYRLAVGRVELPPLRRRTGDVTFLAKTFWAELGGHGRAMPSDLIERLELHPWPGNVRELQNYIAALLALGDSPIADVRPNTPSPHDFLDSVLDQELPISVGRQRVVDEYERRYVARVLAEYDGHVGKASAASGISRRYFQRIRNRTG